MYVTVSRTVQIKLADRRASRRALSTTPMCEGEDCVKNGGVKNKVLGGAVKDRVWAVNVQE
jgi:hypothetical protein